MRSKDTSTTFYQVNFLQHLTGGRDKDGGSPGENIMKLFSHRH
jgi:hypothetical protein